MRGVAVMLLVAGWGVVAGDPTPAAQSVTSASSFSSNGAAVSEAVGPDGTKQGECAYSDNRGLSIKVRYVLRPNAQPEFVLVQGDRGQDPAQAYKTCTEAYKQSQTNAQSAFSMGVFPFFNQFPFNPFAFNPFSRSDAHFDEAAEPLSNRPSSRITSFASNMEAQNRALQQQNLQLQEDLQRMEQQNRDLHRRIMAQVAG